MESLNSLLSGHEKLSIGVVKTAFYVSIGAFLGKILVKNGFLIFFGL